VAAFRAMRGVAGAAERLAACRAGREPSLGEEMEGLVADQARPFGGQAGGARRGLQPSHERVPVEDEFPLRLAAAELHRKPRHRHHQFQRLHPGDADAERVLAGEVVEFGAILGGDRRAPLRFAASRRVIGGELSLAPQRFAMQVVVIVMEPRLVALEAAAERPTVWATAQYLSYAPTGSTVDLEVTLAAIGGNITQARAVGRVGEREILTVNAALGLPPLDISETWVPPPAVPAPAACPERTLPAVFGRSILDRVDVRVARGRSFEGVGELAGDPDSALWARVPGHLEPSAATLAIFGDYVSGAASQPLGRNTMGRSLDNTLRVARLIPTEWVLCDLRIHAIVGGYAQGVAFLWSEDGVLMATASQSFSVRYGPDDWTLPG